MSADTFSVRVAEVEHLETAPRGATPRSRRSQCPRCDAVALQLLAVVLPELGDPLARQDRLREREVRMSGRPYGPYTVKKRRPVSLSPCRWWYTCAKFSFAFFVAPYSDACDPPVFFGEGNQLVEAVHRRRRGVRDGHRLVVLLHRLEQRHEASGGSPGCTRAGSSSRARPPAPPGGSRASRAPRRGRASAGRRRTRRPRRASPSRPRAASPRAPASVHVVVRVEVVDAEHDVAAPPRRRAPCGSRRSPPRR